MELAPSFQIEEISHRIIRILVTERRRSGGTSKTKPPVPKWRWAVWYTALGAALASIFSACHAVLVGLHQQLPGLLSSGRAAGRSR